MKALRQLEQAKETILHSENVTVEVNKQWEEYRKHLLPNQQATILMLPEKCFSTELREEAIAIMRQYGLDAEDQNAVDDFLRGYETWKKERIFSK
jgi:hypothetical protein